MRDTYLSEAGIGSLRHWEGPRTRLTLLPRPRRLTGGVADFRDPPISVTRASVRTYGIEGKDRRTSMPS